MLAAYVAFVSARSRPNTVLATWFDLKVFFTVVATTGMEARANEPQPSLSTIRRVLLLVDTDVLDAVLHAWLAALAEGPGGLRAVMRVDVARSRRTHEPPPAGGRA